jgi:hypothetical protein
MTETVSIAERILSDRFGCGLTLRPDRASNGAKSTVIRCRIKQSSTSVPPTNGT